MNPLPRSLLIANRGEIACRIARTARRLGIETIAVFSAADAGALHVAACDRALPIGPAAAAASYLSIPRILAAAKQVDAAAIHPGYGFLSENPEFPEACAAAGILFVGPPASAMRAMGSKAAAKGLMERSGVPLLPGYHGADQDPAFLASEAARIGFPVVIKAVAGGGGRGMRVVERPGDFADALQSAQQEGASSFGDSRVLIERYVLRPRHIEIQVFADSHGNAVHLFERDCSVQRRHQKVIEEAPAPGMDPATRQAMGHAAVEAARAVGYVGAGTIEFVTDDTGFYFLEMNTRLQVEHPITELITGTDLVEWQLRVAAGGRLPLTQSQIAIHGHAFEARIYAEDPSRDFAPSIGRLAAFHMPSEGDGVRIDTGFAAGDTVSIHYDAMLAKLIVHGPDRDEALLRLRAALAQCQVAGVATNLDLLGRIAAHPEFAAGGIDTGFIAREAGTLLAGQGTPSSSVLAAAALSVLLVEDEAAAASEPRSQDPHSPWNARDQWWPNIETERMLEFRDGDTAYPVRLRRAGHAWRIVAGEATSNEIIGTISRTSDGRLALMLDGARETAAATFVPSATGDDILTLRLRGATFRFRLPGPPADDEEAEAGGRLIAPIPGQVTQVLAKPGLEVARGDLLVVLEAMKTVFRLTARADGAVAAVHCRPGEMVEEGQALVSFVEAPNGPLKI